MLFCRTIYIIKIIQFYLILSLMEFCVKSVYLTVYIIKIKQW